MGYRRHLYWTATISTAAALTGAPAWGSVAADHAAAIVAFPSITVDGAHGIDTMVELTNTSAQPVSVTCYYRTDLGCANAAKFSIRLTPQQPTAWRASAGRTTFPLDGLTTTGPDGSSNAGSLVPPLDDPFAGILECIAVDDAGMPTGRNVLTGRAILEQFQTSPAPFLDTTAYNAIGIPATQETVAQPDGTLLLGGQYSACPQVLALSHFFDGAVEPATKASSVTTTLVLMPCSQDLVYGNVSTMTVKYRVFNEFEQQLGTARVLTACDLPLSLSHIDTATSARSIFSAGVMGTLTGQTRVFTDNVEGGLLGLGIEAYQDLTDASRVRRAAFNVHAIGTRPNPDIIVFAASTVSPTLTPTPEATPTPTTTPTVTATLPAEPLITFFGVARADYTLLTPDGATGDGVPIYQRSVDSGFSLIVEARPGGTQAPIGASALSTDTSMLPDLQVEVSRPLGDGSTAVCDDKPPTIGGVPAVYPFDFSAANAAAINDLSCRFKDGQGQPLGRHAFEACTLFLPEGQYQFVNADSKIQFCGLIDDRLSFPSGDTVVAARVRDASGMLSAVAHLVIRVGNVLPTPHATPTPTRPRPSSTPASATPNATATGTVAAGPAITFFGVTRADYTLVAPTGSTTDGLPIYARQADSGFALVVEGRPGNPPAAIGVNSLNEDVTQLPDLQVEVSRPLGDGSTAVCDDTSPHDGGVPAVSPFDFSAAAAAAINDLSCRFKDGQGQPLGRAASEACTYFLPAGQYQFVDPTSTIQFCGLIDDPLSFSPGDTVVAARLRDVAGNTSPIARIVVRVPAQTPVATATATTTATTSSPPTVAATKTAAAAGPPSSGGSTGNGCAVAPLEHETRTALIPAVLPIVLICWMRRRRWDRLFTSSSCGLGSRRR